MKKISCLIYIVFFSVCALQGNMITDFLKDDTYIVVGNNLNVRAKPDINSKVLTRMEITKIVTVIKRSGLQYSSGNVVGQWVFVDTGRLMPEDYTRNIKGWVVDYFLAQGHQFEKATDFYDLTFNDVYGDYHIRYDFKKNGSFIQYYTEFDCCDGELKTRKTEKIKGFLWRYRDVLIAQGKGLNYFHIDKDKLCFAESKEICADMK